jgi:endonuclease/exonuclease/phosphatase (EEP) superfamily protein YafD
VSRISLDAPSATERRIGLDVTLCVGPAAIRVVGTHCDIDSDAGAKNAIDLVNALRDAIGNGLLLGGDFNALPSDAGPEAAVAAGLVDLAATRDPSPTWGDRREDYVFADSRLAPHVTSATVIATDKSDHRPVVVDFAF